MLFFLAVALLMPFLCGPQHLQHEAGGALSGVCASAMTLAVTAVGSLFALVLIQTLVPPTYTLSTPLLYHPIPKPPQ